MSTVHEMKRLAAVTFVVALGLDVPRAEIQPMTRDRVPEAAEAARKAVKDDQILHANTCRTKRTHTVHMFDVTITTPFAAVALAAFEAKTKGTSLDLTRWPIEPPENQSVIVSVDPAALIPASLPPALPLSVKKVILRRGDVVMEARRSDTHEVHFPDFEQNKRTYRGGAFYFPLEPFASEAGDLELVVVPETDEAGVEAVLRLKQSLLADLR